MYFERPGKVNTQATLSAAGSRARDLGIAEIVVPTRSGETAYAALDLCPGVQVVAVTYHWGYDTPFQPSLVPKVRDDLASRGVRVVTAAHALSGVERAVANKHGGTGPLRLIADTLRLLGQGCKVAVEAAVMAADAGALSGADVVSLGGTSKGVDTALVLQPAHGARFFDLKIREIVCKPRDF